MRSLTGTLTHNKTESKIGNMRGTGILIIRIEFTPKFVQSARITIPQLGIDQRIGSFFRADRVTPGNYTGTLTLLRMNGSEIKKQITINVFHDQDNVHEFDLKELVDEIYLRPVNSLNRTVLRCEMKVENLDANFRIVGKESGIAYRIPPGRYMVKVILPDLQVRTIPVQVVENQTDYPIPLDIEATSTRSEPRYRMSIPVLYRTNEGQWVSTSTTNMSASGLCLVKGIRQVEEKDLKLRLFVPLAKGPLECSATVQWIRNGRSKDSRMGLKLVLPETVRASLEKWLEHSSGGVYA
jgi:PilZ domain